MEENKQAESQQPINVDREKIVDKLIKKLENGKCPMCGQQDFTLIEGYFAHFIQEDISQSRIGGKSIPTINLICNNCGFVSSHAVGIFQSLKKENNEVANS